MGRPWNRACEPRFSPATVELISARCLAWQKASSKYDAERAALLKQVDDANHQGPFRPDGESLHKYEAHHIATYGNQDKFGYKDFVPMFKAEHFDPTAWAELLEQERINTDQTSTCRNDFQSVQ